MQRIASFLGVVSLVLSLAGCSTPDLTSAGESVVASPDPPAPGCVSLGHFVGEGGGTFGGAWISNHALVDYAMNDLRNQAGEAGANYVQYDPPELGDGKGTTTTATISGTGFHCP